MCCKILLLANSYYRAAVGIASKTLENFDFYSDLKDTLAVKVLKNFLLHCSAVLYIL